MQVRYLNDHLASLLDYEPNARLIVPATDDVEVKCDRDGWRRKTNEETVNDDTENSLLSSKNSLRGDATTSNFLKENVPTSCEQKVRFTLQEDQDEWERLCRELPFATTMAERFALLAESNCIRRGNPRKDDPQLMERMTMMKMDGPAEAYECFHRPDRA
jgi:hypothetical protein